jgi:predicted CoA-binding protein
VFPVNPTASEVCGLKVYPDLAAIPEQVDTITVYLSPARSAPLVDEVVAAKARRVILNPGAENPVLMEALQNSGTEVLEACTLVLLHTGQF